MAYRSTRAQRKLAEQAFGLSLAAPQVVAHRLARMAASSSTPSARDRREFTLMGAEKVAAFYESWAAMGLAAFTAQQTMLQSMWRSAALLPLGLSRPASLLPTPAALTAHTVRVVSQGLAPVHKRAAGNAKRLGRLKSRR
jgi:hypothetical protein